MLVLQVPDGATAHGTQRRDALMIAAFEARVIPMKAVPPIV